MSSEPPNKPPPPPARGAGENPPNRFEPLELAEDPEFWESEHLAGSKKKTPTQTFIDSSRTILAKNDSPDIPFSYGVNPYRGCEHGCSYCYARPSHEFLGFSAGLDFETRIMVKTQAANLLAKELSRPSWQPQIVALSGNTDCYQPLERRLKITRACLEVFLRFGNPVGIITKNALITRDLDILKKLAEKNLVEATISITTLDPQLAKTMEPRASHPQKRLEAIHQLAGAGIPVRVNTAPVIPGLNDHEMPGILKLAAEAGATSANYILLRLPLTVEPVFLEWLHRTHPDRANKVISAIKDTRQGEMYDNRFQVRLKGTGHRAETIEKLFTLHCKKNNLHLPHTTLATNHFHAPTQTRSGATQEELF